MSKFLLANKWNEHVVAETEVREENNRFSENRKIAKPSKGQSRKAYMAIKRNKEKRMIVTF